MRRYGVRPSVCLWFIRPRQQRVTGLLLWARQVEDIDRLLHQRRANAGNATLSAYIGS